jgi:hypothetical protein
MGMVQGGAVQLHGANQRYFFRHEFRGKLMLFKYLHITPTLRSVELGHDGAVVIQHDLVHAVFVRAECVESPIHSQT